MAKLLTIDQLAKARGTVVLAEGGEAVASSTTSSTTKPPAIRCGSPSVEPAAPARSFPPPAPISRRTASMFPTPYS